MGTQASATSPPEFRPITEDEIAVKFTALGVGIIGKEQCEKLRKCIMNVDD